MVDTGFRQRKKNKRENGLVVVVGVVGGVDHDEVLHVQEGVVGHPGGGVVDEADGFTLDVPETLAEG